MRRKIISMLLVLAMVLSLAVGVSAAETGTVGAALTLEAAGSGTEVVLTAYLHNCGGVTNGRFSVDYDAEVLTLAEAKVSDAYAMSSVNKDTAGTVSLAWVGSELTAEKTLMLTLRFTLAAGSVEDPGASLTFSAESDGIYAETDLVAVAGATVTGLTPSGAVNKTELEKAIAAAEKLNPGDYTSGSYAAVEDALKDAKAVLADRNATQAEVDAAAKALNDAIAALVKVSSGTGSNGPGTGDNFNMMLWIVLLAVCAVAIGVVIFLLFRSSKGKKGGKRKKGGRFLSLLLVLTMVLTMMPTQVLAAVVDGQDNASGASSSLSGLDTSIVTGETAGPSATKIEDMDIDLTVDQNLAILAQAPHADEDLVRVIIELENDGLLAQGYTQDEILSLSGDVSDAAAALEQQQAEIAVQIAKVVKNADCTATAISDGQEVTTDIKYNYTIALNGVAMVVPYGTLSQIREMEGVKNAYVVSQYTLPETDDTYDPNMYATQETFGTTQTWTELGYTGEGMVIAIIDTGLDLDHPSFAETPAGASMTVEDIDGVLTQLKAYSLFAETSAVNLTAGKLYRSGKVAYGFNYVDRSLDITHDYDGQGDHGTHVAGTAAANRLGTTDVVGVAPDAQLVVMKVFGQNGGAYSDDIIAAIEDCVLLDVDVINMSLGSPAGFSEDSELINEVFGRILECDMLLACAAGNSGSVANGNSLGTNLNLSSDPDIGMVTSPSTYLGSTMVASLENASMMMPYFTVGGNKIAYVDINYTFTNFSGSEMEYVVIPNYGRAADYQGLDVSGKIAVVSRGGGDDVTFVVKQENAYNAGAAALIVYNNVEGDLISMYDGGFLPNVFISKADGATLIELADSNGVGTLEIMPVGEETAIPSPTAGQLSDFSAWGVTPDLLLAPDVTAPGGNIYSCLTDGRYGTMSGTSMASPHIAGMSALVLQYLHEKYPNMSESEMHAATESLVMCTAVPVEDTEGVLYSPRKQGAGSANVYSAVISPVYLTSQQANGEQTPKASVGDDPSKSGVYSFSFTMHNFSAENQTYALDGVAMTDQYVELDGLEYIGEADRYLDGTLEFSILTEEGLAREYDANQDGTTDMKDVQFMLDVVNGLETLADELHDLMDLNPDSILNTVDVQLLYELLLSGYEARDLVTVPAGETVTVYVTVTLSADDKAYMDAHYANGIYVEGFVRAYAQSDSAVDLSLPYVGFYGDWTAAPMIDTGWYYEDEETVTYNRYLNVVFANMATGAGGLGINPYVLEAEYDPEHNVLSPNSDGYYDYVNEIYVSLLRSAELLDFTWTDENGSQLFYEWYAYARKSYYWSGYGTCLPVIYTDGGCLPYTMMDEYGNLLLEDNQHITLTIRGYLDDGDLDALEVDDEGNPLPDTSWADAEVEIPVVVDISEPVLDISSIRYITEDGRTYVSFDVSDNYDIAAVIPMTVGGDVYDYLPVEGKESGVDGETATISIDITDFDETFRIAVCDYACNESYYELVNTVNEGLNGDDFYAFRRYSTIETDSTIYTTDQLNGWYSFATADDMTMHTSQANSGEATVFAAEYIDGYIIGAQAGENNYNTLFVMKAGSWNRDILGDKYNAMRFTAYEWPGRDGTYFPLQLIALDMAYDYTTDTLYMLANGLENNYFPDGAEDLLLKVDYTTGAVTFLGVIEPAKGENFLALTLACDNDGKLYTINYENGQLYTIGKTPVSTTAKYGYGTYEATSVDADNKVSYYPAAYTQSMTVDHETNKLYWAGYQGKTGLAYFMELDKQTGEIITMTHSENNAEMVALFKPFDSGKDLIPESDLKAIHVNEDEIFLNVGQNTLLSVIPSPYSAAVGSVAWSSADESIATVSEHGIVEAIGVGITTVTATCGDLTASCTVNVTDVSGTLFAHSGDYWLLMDAGDPSTASQVTDAMELDGNVQAAAYVNGMIYAAAVEEGVGSNTTNLYMLEASTLQGTLVGSYTGNTTALAFNYADGFMYAITSESVYTSDDNYDDYSLIRINLSTADTVEAADLNQLFDSKDKYEVCSGALAIDYDGNFYVNGQNSKEQNILVRFSLDENGALTNMTTFSSFSDCNWYGDAMVWSQRNGGIIRASGEELSWVDVSGIDNGSVTEIRLGKVRGVDGSVLALAIPVTQEPDLPQVNPTAIYLDDTYTVPTGETLKISPTADPWNANCTYTYAIADESIATVSENGIITGVAIGTTTVTVTAAGTDLSATATVEVVKNPGYLYGFAQADIAQGVPLEYWIKMPISNTGNGTVMTGSYDFTIYAAEYYDGYIYAYAQSAVDYRYYFLRINPSSFTYEFISESSLMVRDMAFDYTSGTMYLVAYDDVVKGGLYQVNLITGAVTLVGDNDQGVTLVTLAVDAGGNMYAASDSGTLYAVNKDTAALTATGIAGGSSQYLQAMTYSHDNDAIYWAQSGTIYQVDVAKGTLTAIGLADVNSGSMATTGCIVSGLLCVPTEAPAVPASVTPTGVVLDEKNTVAVGETLTLDAVVLPVSVSAVDLSLTWTSSNETVAAVDENGVVTGISAGEVDITATTSNGKTDTIHIVVTEEHRYFYGYDEISRSWVSFDLDGKIVGSWPDAEGLSPIVAAQYIGDTLYAYDEDGYFYSVDTETFARTKLGNGINGLTVDLEAWDKTHDENVYYVEDVPYRVIDMTYTVDHRGNYAVYAAIMAWNVSTWRDSFSYKIVKINLKDGSIATNGIIVEDVLVDGEMSLRPTNLIYRGGYLYTVNGYITGMVTKIDTIKKTVSGTFIFAGYWGDFNGGRSLIEDPLTGEVYAIRDMRTEYIGTENYTGAYAVSELCRISLGIACCESIATIGTNVRLTGLFIK